MKLIYAPKGEQPQEWEYSFGSLKVREIKLIESVHDETVGEFFKRLEGGSYTRLLTLFWLMRSRVEKCSLTDFDDMDADALTIEADEDETPEADAGDPKASSDSDENLSSPPSSTA